MSAVYAMNQDRYVSTKVVGLLFLVALTNRGYGIYSIDSPYAREYLCSSLGYSTNRRRVPLRLLYPPGLFI